MRSLFSRVASRRAAVMLTVACVLATGSVTASASAPADQPVPLHGNKVAGLSPTDRVADDDPARTIDIQLALQLRNRAQLDQLIQRVSTPSSAEYGHYLTPAQFDAQFGPTAAQVNQATAFLRASGLQVISAVAGSTVVDARGTVAQVEAALHTSIGRFHDRAGNDFFANDSEPSLPATLASFVVGVQGLNNRYRRHHAAALPRACPPTCAATPYSPTQIRKAYQLSAAPLANLTGTGQTLGLLELDDFLQANLNGFTSAYALPAITPNRQLVDGGVATSNGQVEVELDIEVMHGIAPNADIQVFEAPNTDSGLIDAYGCMVNPAGDAGCPNHGSGLISYANSTGWGLCEGLQLTTTTNALHTIFSQAAAQGQSFFAASGDSGSNDCGDNTKTVDSPAADTFMTGVGGTRLLLNPDNSYNSETVWPPSSGHPTWGSGGGYSKIYARPTWQTGPGVDVTTGAMRQVPDISLDADPVTGYSIYTCKSIPAPCTSGGGLKSIGGTSAGAPAWAAFAAIYNQYAACQGQPKLGFANPALYPLGVTPPTFTPFNDITTGDNVAGNPAGGYSASEGYDMVSGLGTLRASDLLQDLIPGVSAVSVVSASPSQGSGGETVHVIGCGFQTAAGQVPAVAFGGTASPSVTFVSSTDLAAVVPAQAPGSVSVGVTNPAGAGGGTFTLVNAFTIVVRQYIALTPARILDTRADSPQIGACPATSSQCATMGQGTTLNVQVRGLGGVPPSGAQAVVINVTVDRTTAAGYLTIYPAGVSRPVASSLNWAPGQTLANLVEVPLGAGGQLSVYNFAGNTDVIFDVAGYVSGAASPTPSLFHSESPRRILDTRPGSGLDTFGTMSTGSTQAFKVIGGSTGVPDSTSVTAVVLNVTATNTTADAYLTVYPHGQSRPVVSNLDWAGGRTVPNRVIVAVGSGGMIDLYNFLGNTDVIIDIGGWFSTDPSTNGGFAPLAPVRILDTRFGTGTYTGTTGPGGTITLLVAGQGGVPLMSAQTPPTAVVLNVTITDTTVDSFLTVFPSNVGAPPLASDLNWPPGTTVANMVVVRLGPDGQIKLFNHAGNSDMVVDLQGWNS